MTIFGTPSLSYSAKQIRSHYLNDKISKQSSGKVLSSLGGKTAFRLTHIHLESVHKIHAGGRFIYPVDLYRCSKYTGLVYCPQAVPYTHYAASTYTPHTKKKKKKTIHYTLSAQNGYNLHSPPSQTPHFTRNKDNKSR